MEEREILKIFEKHEALLRGHFKLSSGLHADTYLQCAKVLQYPEVAGRLCAELAGLLPDDGVDVVAGIAVGSITLGYELARALGARAIFGERQNGAMTLRRGFRIEPAESVLIAEDVVTTGGSVMEVIELVKELKGDVRGVACLVNRGGAPSLPVRCTSLVDLDLKTFTEDECPLCKQGVAIEAPGSRHGK
jgi:orotate phosphoribosyltransferase